MSLVCRFAEKDEFQLKVGILEDLEMTDDYWYFAANTPLIKQGTFWVAATTRCFFIEAAMRKVRLPAFIHLMV